MVFFKKCILNFKSKVFGIKMTSNPQRSNNGDGLQGTLVKLDNPTLVTSHKKGFGAHKSDTSQRLVEPCTESTAQKRETEEILNAILPPKEWMEDGKTWRQKVSSVPATRLDVITLQEQLDLKLKQGQARETGICPIRRELYSQCFDELIRQVTINCAERGILLLRVRDEMRMTIGAYQSLYESCTAFGIRKALTSESNKNKLESEVGELQNQKEELDRTIEELDLQIQAMEKKYADELVTNERVHNDEVKSLKKANLQLKHQLEMILTYKKTGNPGVGTEKNAL